ncbi:hypothetical protein BH10PSE5_BH10PSE5_01280 [soil metagenome]
MRARIITIALDNDGVLFPEGAIVTADVELPKAVILGLLAAQRAELVEGEAHAAELQASLDDYMVVFQATREPLLALIDQVERLGIDAARAFVAFMDARSPEEMPATLRRIEAIYDSVKASDRAWISASQVSSAEGSPAQVVEEVANSAAASEDAASDAPAASEVLSAVEPTDYEITAAPSAVVETPATADTDTPPAIDQAATAEPAAVAQDAAGDPPKAKAKARAKAGGNPAAGS